MANIQNRLSFTSRFLTRGKVLFSILAVLALGVDVHAQTVVRTNGGTETATGTDVSVVQKASGWASGDVISVSGTSATSIAPFSTSVRVESSSNYTVTDFTVQSATGDKQYIGALPNLRNYVLKLKNTDYNITFKDVEFKYNQNPQATFGIVLTMNADSDSTVTLNLDNASFTKFNTTGNNAGAVIYSTGDLTINGTNDVSFSENVSNAGGAISVSTNITMNCNNITFNSNSSRTTGGAINLDKTLKITGSTIAFSNNTANTEGGAIRSTGNGMEIDGNTVIFSSNTGNTYGGAIRLNNTNTDNKVFITGETVTFDNNSASNNNGGAIHTNASVEVKGKSDNSVITFSNNTAPNGNSGAIVAVGSVEFSTGSFIFQNNSAGGFAGAIEARKGITFSGYNTSATFTGNTAGTDGNDLYLSNANSVLTFKDGGTYSFDGGIYLADATQSTVINKAQVTIAGRQYKPRANEDDPLEEDTTNNYQLQTVNISNGGKLTVNLDYLDSLTGTINVGTDESEGTLEISVGEGLSKALPDTFSVSLADKGSFAKTGAGTLELDDSVDVKSLTLVEGSLKLNGSVTGDILVNNGVFSPDAASGTTSVTGNVTITDDGTILFEFSSFEQGLFDVLEIVGDDNAFTAGDKTIQLLFETGDEDDWYAFLVDNPDGYQLVSDNGFTPPGEVTNLTGWLSDNYGLFGLEGREGGLYLVAAPEPGSGVPEPSTWALLVLGVAGLLYWRKRKN